MWTMRVRCIQTLYTYVRMSYTEGVLPWKGSEHRNKWAREEICFDKSLIRCSPWIVQRNWHGTSTLTSQAPPTRSLNEARVWKIMSSCTSKFHYIQIFLLSFAAWHGIGAANVLTAYEPPSSDAQISCLRSASTGNRVRRCWISKCGGRALATHVTKFHTSDSSHCWSRRIPWRTTEMIRFYTNPDVLPLPTSFPILQFRRPSMYSDCCSNTYKLE